MNRSNETVAVAIDEEELKVFVRADRTLEPGEMERVAGGIGTCIVPLG